MKEFFSENKKEYIKASGDNHPCKYECMECGTIFYGAWHSSYTIGKVKCPLCGDDTDPYFVKIIDMD